METTIERDVYRLIRDYHCFMQDGTDRVLPQGTFIVQSREAKAWFPAAVREALTLRSPLDPKQPQPLVYRTTAMWRLREAFRCPIGRQQIDLPKHALLAPRSKLFMVIQEFFSELKLFDLVAVLVPLTPEPEVLSTGSTPAPEDVTQRRQGRPHRYASAQTLHDDLVTAGKTLPKNSLYRQEDYTGAMFIGVDTLRSHLKYWRKEDPTDLLVWGRIVSDTKA